MSDTPVLALRDVSRTFRISRGLMRGKATLRAVDSVSLQLRRGEVLALVGESGCGKTTLSRILLGLLPPSSGEVLIDGQPMKPADRKARARRIQPVFQDPYSSLNPRKTVAQIVAAPLQVHQVGDPAGRARVVAETLDLVGLPRRVADSYPGQMSGGQRQRVAIARALVMRPEVMICDEPTSALDVSVQSQILNLLLDLQKELGLTYLLISHNLAVVEHIANRVAVMYLGRIVEVAPTARLFAEARHPYTRALLESVLTPEPGLGVPDTHLGVAYPNPIDPPSGCAFHPRCPSVLPICSQVRPQTLRDALGRIECHLHGPAPTGAASAAPQEQPQEHS
ncbi:peptide/nickel transport system ATP-binding protein [Tistlia consotensis]|uniref:Peptide/nickel transport system ATP-binding protein n=1 Tax=Tistlia consotensis USBA 355 TaxID=560819 RepID=A0A1Y6CI50_9PROT|nr:oligopeptide/dipeptide ABC transporter ATP-binding protein [Tistlia consotensis]SMF64192.1 peptide/nickel transport system ATP-binding protein [Tistlia consotensis USBA 355]SNR97757.1 peptide/nickel transport system ATP-binding protein [Tistlia consotensis]